MCLRFMSLLLTFLKFDLETLGTLRVGFIVDCCYNWWLAWDVGELSWLLSCSFDTLRSVLGSKPCILMLCSVLSSSSLLPKSCSWMLCCRGLPYSYTCSICRLGTILGDILVGLSASSASISSRRIGCLVFSALTGERIVPEMSGALMDKDESLERESSTIMCILLL